MEIADLDSLQGKWSTEVQASESLWISGYQNPRTDWETATAEAEDRWRDAADTDQAASEFQTKVEATGQEGFMEAMNNYGFTRYGDAWVGPRLDMTLSRWEDRFWDEYINVIEGVTLPPPENLTPNDYWNQINRNVDNRLRPICNAIHQHKQEIGRG